MAQQQDIKQNSLSAIWRVAYVVVLETKSELFYALQSSWQYILTNLSLFTWSFDVGKIYKIYNNITSEIEDDKISIISQLEMYCSVDTVLNHSEVRNFMKKQIPHFAHADFQAILIDRPAIVTQINKRLTASIEIIQKHIQHITITQLETYTKHEILSSPIQLSQNDISS